MFWFIEVVLRQGLEKHLGRVKGRALKELQDDEIHPLNRNENYYGTGPNGGTIFIPCLETLCIGLSRMK